MGSSKKNDRRAANYQERQRQDAAKAKAEKDRQKREDFWGQAVVPSQQYVSGGIVSSCGTWILPAGVSIVGANTAGGWTVSTDVAQVETGALPKSESTELITAYRMWNLKRTFPQGYRLIPLNDNFGEVIPCEKMVARCQAGASHPAPQEFCTCGIHAYSKSVPLEPSAKPYAAGEVYLWGKVIVHEHGFRAQFAYPKRLYVIDGGPRANKIADALELTYGVPCSVWDG